MRTLKQEPLISMLLSCIILLLTACTSQEKQDLQKIKKIYSKAASYHDADLVPVIVIPGILGSNLLDTETNQEAWGVFQGNYLRPNSPAGIKALSITPKKGVALSNLKTSLVPNGALKEVHFKAFGLPIQAKAYGSIMKTLGVGGFKDDSLNYKTFLNYGKSHFTCFQFDYDWRYSSAYNAAKLHEYIEEKKRYVRSEIKKRYGVDRTNIKFNIVAHSMGGLVARYYARYGTQSLPEKGLPKLTWAGAKNINKLFLVATPNSGSIASLEDLINGKELAPGWTKYIPGITLKYYPPEILGTYPAVYELLSRKRHNVLLDPDANQLDPLDYEVWKKYKWGLAAGDPKILKNVISHDLSDDELNDIAHDHLRKCLNNARQFQKALDRPTTTKPDHLKITLYVGDAFYTLSRVMVDRKTHGVIRNNYELGDETVLRTSVLADVNTGRETKNPKVISPIPYDDVRFVFKKHIGITQDVNFADNLLYELLQR